MVADASSRKVQIRQLLDELEGFEVCGPSDDSDKLVSVALGFQHLLAQLKRVAFPLLPQADADRLQALSIDVHDIYTVYAARSEVDALLPDIRESVEAADDDVFATRRRSCIVDPNLIAKLESEPASTFDLSLLAQMCREINACFAHGHIMATALLMRTILNYVPPIFGHQEFKQVAAQQAGKSHKDAFGHLQEGLRKIADFQAHRRADGHGFYPSAAQVEPYKPQLELLLHAVLERAQAR